jgi:hypothetical protein
MAAGDTDILPWSSVGKMGDSGGRSSYVGFSGADEDVMLWRLSPGGRNCWETLKSMSERSEG